MHYSICGLLKSLFVVLMRYLHFSLLFLPSSVVTKQQLCLFLFHAILVFHLSNNVLFATWMKPSGLPWCVQAFSFLLLPDPCWLLCAQLAMTMERLCDISPASVLPLNRDYDSFSAIVSVATIKQLACWRSDNASQPPTAAERRLTWGIIGCIPTIDIQIIINDKLQPEDGQLLSG